ncbi:hypothetical protein ACQZV8_18550 [Magnetococcales bacterium HHB-1]
MLDPVYDPYDLWSTPWGVKARSWFYQGRLSGKAAAASIALLDWLMPQMSRHFFCTPRLYPIVVAHHTLTLKQLGKLDHTICAKLLSQMKQCATDPTGKSGWSWGLGFPWMSKNGLYGSEIPFITHTPYILEALLAMRDHAHNAEEITSLFHDSWQFLESLQVMVERSDSLALSYAPIHEPRIVINANSYAALTYALHAQFGTPSNQQRAAHRAEKLIQWVVDQQQEDGAWLYYADQEPGNFIDCFHSCFVLKNLLKVGNLLPTTKKITMQAIERGWSSVQAHFLDSKTGLCRRFSHQGIRGPFKWDIYDQAEYLGLLIDLGNKKEAETFADHVTEHFFYQDHWYCKKDLFGRRWGKGFDRWGIAPFLYHKARINTIHLPDKKSKS